MIRRLASRLAGKIYALRTGYHNTEERVNPDFVDDNFRNHLRFYQFASQFVADKNVLDCGCGTGYGTALLADSGAQSVLGIDLSKEAIDFAGRRFACSNATFRVMDAQSLLVPDASFDFVYSSENLEHLNDPEKNIREIKRILRPGGMLLLGTPNKELFSPGREPENSFHVREFYFEELNSLLSCCFENVHIFENTIEPNEPLGLEMRRERLERGAVGIRPQGLSHVNCGGLTVDLKHLHNTHSFVCLCW